jgi:RNA recognition motif-containing protein
LKLPAHRAGLPGKVISFFCIVPLDPAYKAGLAGHVPVKALGGSFPFGVSEEDLKKIFSQAGEAQSLKITMDPYSRRPRGFGFVEMTSKAEAAKAISLLNGRILTDRALIVSEAKPQKKRGSEFGGRGDSNRSIPIYKNKPVYNR